MAEGWKDKASDWMDGRGKKEIGVVVGGGIVVFLLIGVGISLAVGRDDPPATTPTGAARPVVAPTVIVRPVGQFLHPYRFGSNGCVRVFLRGDWMSYPMGGEVTFTSQETGREVLRRTPGTPQRSSLSAGYYIICRSDRDSDASGVHIWLRTVPP